MLTTVHSCYTARPLCWSATAMSSVLTGRQCNNNLSLSDLMSSECFTLTTWVSWSEFTGQYMVLTSQSGPSGALKTYGRGSICQSLRTRAVLRREAREERLIYRLGTADSRRREEAVGSVTVALQPDCWRTSKGTLLSRRSSHEIIWK